MVARDFSVRARNMQVHKCSGDAYQKFVGSLIHFGQRENVHHADHDRTAPERRSCRSIVSTGTWSARAVAAIIRSAGSFDKVDGRARSSSAITDVIWTKRTASGCVASAIHFLGFGKSATRDFPTSNEISHKLITLSSGGDASCCSALRYLAFNCGRSAIHQIQT